MKKNRKPNKKAVGQRARLSEREQEMINDYRSNEETRVLVIGDTHCPFDLDTYVDFLEWGLQVFLKNGLKNTMK